EPLAPLKFFPRQMVRRPLQQVPYAGPTAAGTGIMPEGIFSQAPVTQEMGLHAPVAQGPIAQAPVAHGMIVQEIVPQEVVPYLTEQPRSPVTSEPAWNPMQGAGTPSFTQPMPAIGPGHVVQSVPAPQLMPATHPVAVPQAV